MTFGERLTQLRKDAGYSTRNEFADKLGIPSTTLRNYETDVREPGHTFLKQMSEMFNVSVDYLLCLTNEKEKISDYQLKASEFEHIKKYRRLDIHSKNIVDTIIDLELKRIEESSVNEDVEENIVYINFAQNSASAGSGDVLFGDIDDTPLALVENRITNKADFAVRVNGNSMLPNFSNGDIVLASKQPVDNGDIGLFVVNGNGYIKKKGSRELISLNPKFDNVQIGEYDTVYCMGKVIGKVKDEWIR